MKYCTLNPKKYSMILDQDLLWDYGGIMQGARVVDVNRIVSAALFLKVYSDVI
jgi:hypothetical protein